MSGIDPGRKRHRSLPARYVQSPEKRKKGAVRPRNAACKPIPEPKAASAPKIIDGSFSMGQKILMVYFALQVAKHKEYWAVKHSELAKASAELQRKPLASLSPELQAVWNNWTQGFTHEGARGQQKIVGAHPSWFCWPRDPSNSALLSQTSLPGALIGPSLRQCAGMVANSCTLWEFVCAVLILYTLHANSNCVTYNPVSRPHASPNHTYLEPICCGAGMLPAHPLGTTTVQDLQRWLGNTAPVMCFIDGCAQTNRFIIERDWDGMQIDNPWDRWHVVKGDRHDVHEKLKCAPISSTHITV